MMSAQTDTWPKPRRLTVDEYYRMAEVGWEKYWEQGMKRPETEDIFNFEN